MDICDLPSRVGSDDSDRSRLVGVLRRGPCETEVTAALRLLPQPTIPNRCVSQASRRAPSLLARRDLGRAQQDFRRIGSYDGLFAGLIHRESVRDRKFEDLDRTE